MRPALLAILLLGCSLDDQGADEESFATMRCADMALHAKNGLFDEEVYCRCLYGHASAPDAGTDR